MKTIIVDCRKSDSMSRMVVKYVDSKGKPIQYKPVRDISPDINKLIPAAKFIMDHADGKYVGGFLLNGFYVRVEGAPGTQWAIDARVHGEENAEKIYQSYGIDKNERASIRGWLWPIFEPKTDETQYINNVTSAMMHAAGYGGRLVIKNGDNRYIYEVSNE